MSSLRSPILKLLSLFPLRLRTILASLFSDSCRQTDGTLSRYTGFSLNKLSSLSSDSQKLQLYYNCLKRASDEITDNIYKVLRHLNLYSIFEHVLFRSVSGDIAECGTFNGNSLFAMLSIPKSFDTIKTIYSFDSYEFGLSDFKERDLDGLSYSPARQQQIGQSFSSS